MHANQNLGSNQRDCMVDSLNNELCLMTKGYTTAIEVYPGGRKDGLDYGPVLVEIVVLDNDGATIAYRMSTDAQDDDWQIGTPEDAVAECLNYREQMEAEKRYMAIEQDFYASLEVA